MKLCGAALVPAEAEVDQDDDRAGQGADAEADVLDGVVRRRDELFELGQDEEGRDPQVPVAGLVGEVLDEEAARADEPGAAQVLGVVGQHVMEDG